VREEVEVKRHLRRHKQWLKRSFIHYSFKSSQAGQGIRGAAAKRILAMAAILLVLGLAASLAIGVPAAHADPAIDSVSPDTGSPGQTLGFTIYGSGFTGLDPELDSVLFGSGTDIEVTGFEAIGDSQIVGNMIISRSAACGSRSVSVTAGSSSYTKSNAFTVLRPPVVSSIWPNSGDQGTTLSLVTIEGACFLKEIGEIQVDFFDFPGGTPDTDISGNFLQISSDFTITGNIIIGANAILGLHTVRVTTPGGWGLLPASFTVEKPPPAITLASPNSVYPGQTEYVQIYGSNFWGASEVSFGSGVTVIAFFAFSDTWIMAKVSVADNAAPGFRDVSVTGRDGVGTLPVGFGVPQDRPMIKVLSPNSGTESWEIGSAQAITWTSTSDLRGPVKIDVSTNGGLTWESAIPLTDNEGIAIWKVSKGPTNRALIRVSTIFYPLVSDESDLMFALTAGPTSPTTLPTIKVLSPNGGERWTIGSDQTITWTSSAGFAEEVSILLSTDGGQTWKTIISSTPNDGTESWKVTGTPTNEAFIMVLSKSGTAVIDISDANFSTSSI